jgi:putative ABC transport system permease protein
VRPLASATGIPLERLRGLTGRLARENAQRKPGRTAVTAAALMIGLALVTFVTVFAAGIKSSISSAIDRNFQGELVIQNTDGFAPIPPGAATVARNTPGVAAVSSLGTSQARVIENGGGKPRVSSIDPSSASKVLSLDWVEGSPRTLTDLTDSQIVVDEGFADSNGLEVGDRVRFLTQIGRRPSFEIAGVVKDNADLLGMGVITNRAMVREFGQTDDTFDFIRLASGADAAAVQRRLTRAIERPFPTSEVLNQQELKDNQEGQVDQLLGLIYGLLSLAVIVSLFGIANTLALSIHERTRELGMLRAVGMTKRQVRRMIRYESVITALIGAAIGIALGIVLAVLLIARVDFIVLSWPVGSLFVFVVAALVVGLIAAIFPARRASRLNVLEALQYE